MSQRQRAVEETIDGLAAAQHGVVGRRQLLRAGVPPDVVDRRLKTGRLVAVHRGVYRVGPVRAPRAAEMAAVLACGETGLVSHRSAACLWHLLPDRRRPDSVDVIVLSGYHGRRPGIHAHRVRSLHRDEATKLDRIPVTTAARTLCDLASIADLRELERALAQAICNRLTTHARITAVLARHPRRRGAGRLREILDDETRVRLTRSEAEERFLTLVRKAQLPLPATNVDVGGLEVDFLWRAERFIVEIDGFAFHSSASMFQSDRRRDATLVAAGFRVTRVTWRQLVNEPEALLTRLAQALVRSSAR